MKEKDIIKHAKNYMEMLSVGINPITKEPYDEKSDINNERLLKCFGFVASILERVVNEEEQKEKQNQSRHNSSESGFNKTNAEKGFNYTKYDVSVDSPVAPNSIVPDEITGKDVVDILLKKGLIKQGTEK